jgi:hypothetical protein
MKYFLLYFCPSGKSATFSNWLAAKNILTITFFEPIVGHTLGTISSRARADIVGES